MVVGLSPKGQCDIKKWFVVLKRKLKFPELCVPCCSLSRRHALIYQSNKENPNPNIINYYFFWIGQHFNCTFPFQILSCFLFIKATSSSPEFFFPPASSIKVQSSAFFWTVSLGTNLGLSPKLLVKFCIALMFSTLSGKYVCFLLLIFLMSWFGETFRIFFFFSF